MSRLSSVFVLFRSFLTLFSPPSAGEGGRVLLLASPRDLLHTVDSGHVSSNSPPSLFPHAVYSQRELTRSPFRPPAAQTRPRWRGTSRTTPASGGARRGCRAARGALALLPSRLTPPRGNDIIALRRATPPKPAAALKLFPSCVFFFFSSSQTDLSRPRLEPQLASIRSLSVSVRLQLAVRIWTFRWVLSYFLLFKAYVSV